MNQQKDAFVWLELLVAVSACVFISLVGMRTLSLFLEGQAREQAAEMEASEIHGLGQRIQRLFDQRVDSTFSDMPGLDFQGSPTVEGLILDRMQLQVYLVGREKGGVSAIWKLEREDGRWSESMQFADGSDPEVRDLQYEGGILIVRDPPGESQHPVMMRWTFPGSTSRLAQEGFAIFAFW